MIRLLLASMIAFYITPGNCLAEKVGPAQQLQYFGNRMMEGTWIQKSPSDGVGSQHVYKWALGNSFVLRYEKNAGKPDALTVGGVDPKTKLQTWWSFQNDGNIQITRADVDRVAPDADKVMLVDKDGDTIGVADVEYEGEDTLLIDPQSGTDASGAKLVAEKWQRSEDVDIGWLDAKQPAKTPAQMWLARHSTGKKWIDGVMPDGSEFLGAGYGKWILSGKFHVFTSSTAGNDQTTWGHVVITGIDPKTNKLAAWEFTSLGATNYVTFDNSGQTITGEGMLPDGSTHSFKGRFEMDGNTLRYKSKISLNSGEAMPYGWNYRDAD